MVFLLEVKDAAQGLAIGSFVNDKRVPQCVLFGSEQNLRADA